MAVEQHDFIIVGGGSAGCALANRLSASPSNRVLVLEAGRPDYLFDVFIHMPAALTFPIGSRYYDWRYESEPEPFMNGRRIYHARGKVLGGSSSINGMIFQRGNPLDYERWAADPGMDTWDYAHCLPYFRRMESCLAGALDDSSAATPGRSSSSAGRRPAPAVRGVLRGGAAGRLPAHRRRQRLPPGGLRAASTATSTAAGAERGSRAYLHPVMVAAEPRVRTRRVRHADPVRRHARRRGRVHDGRARSDRAAGRGRSSAAGRSTRRSSSSCRASATPDELGALGIAPSSPTCPASARTSRTTSRSTSSTRASCRCRCSPRSRSGGGRGSAASGCSCGAGPGRRTTSRAAASSAATTTSPTRT